MRWSSIESLFARCALALCALAPACQGGEPASAPSVCPMCDPRAGGETGDWGGGSQTECGAVSRPLAIDEATAEELGYDVARIRRLLERGIDAPLRWEARPLEVGDPAGGYEPDTRVRGTASISSFEHVRPDPEFCDGTTCMLEDMPPFDQAPCPDFLRMGLEVEIETLDGAITAVAHGELWQWNDDPRFYPMIGEDTADHPIGDAYANLYDVTGSLTLNPPEGAVGGDAGPYAVQGGHPFPGTLVVEIELMDDMTHGAVWPAIWWDVPDDHGDSMLETYEPLMGRFPPEDG